MVNDRSRRLTIYMTQHTFDALKFRALHNHASVEGYIKQLINRQQTSNKLPPLEPFQRHYPTTKGIPLNGVPITSPYDRSHIAYLDALATDLTHIYTTEAKTRRRLIETLVLIDLFN